MTTQSDGLSPSVIPMFDEAGIPIAPKAREKALASTRDLSRAQAGRQAELFEEYAAIRGQDAWAANTAGFLPSALVQASLPYRNPGDIPVFRKTNGNVSLLIKPGDGIVNQTAFDKAGREYIEHIAVSYGYPYGSIPRLLLAWITTQAMTTRQRELQLGKNLSHFMSLLGIHNVTGGSTGSIGRLKDQTNRLLSAHITLVRHKASFNDTSLVSRPLQITSQNAIQDDSAIWDTDLQCHKKRDPFGSVITLSQDFFDELLANPVPLDFRALKLLRASPLALDTYAWLTWSMFKLKREAMIDWGALFRQFGSSGSERKFKENFRSALRHVLAVYPEARVVAGPAGILLRPSPTHVPIKRTLFPAASEIRA